MKKISIKREQSQVGLSFAEREKFRPQVKIKLLLLLVLLMTAATGAWAQNDASAMREQMKERIDALKALAPDNVKGLNETLKNDINVYKELYTGWYNASPLKSYDDYEEAYDHLGFIIDRVNKYLAAYKEFTVNMAKLQTLINNFNADTEKKQGYKTFAQNVYNAYKALSDYDMIALDDDDVEAQKNYDDDVHNYVPDVVTSDNIADVDDRPEEYLYISTYGQFTAFFIQNTKELGSIYLEVAGTGTAESPENLTAQLRNPNLKNAGEQWWGTEWTSFGNSAAEQSGKPFITYQQVHLPQGYYTLVGYGMDRRGSWADVLANDENWNDNHKTYLFSKLDYDSDSTMVDAFKAKNMALTTDITEGAGNISTCQVDGVTYYTPNDMAQYRAWEDANIAMTGNGHRAVVQFYVYEENEGEGDFGSLGFAHRWHVDNTWFVADGIHLYYAKDNFPDISIDTPNAGEPTYAVTLAEGTEDADKWTVKVGEGEAQAFPVEGLKGGEAVTVKYNGSREVKSVTVVKKVEKAVNPNTYLAWNADQKKLVATPMPESFTTVTSSTTTWSAGTYVVEGQVDINGTVELSGDVNLIIKDGAKLAVYHLYGNSHNLSIYGQAQKTGELVVNHSGGDAINEIPTLEVHSAKVTATSSESYGAGFYEIGTFNVYGGLVDAKGTAAEGGTGIVLKEVGYMNIYGGEVKAEGKGIDLNSYGITSSASIASDAANVTVYGGKLWAGCADNQALNNDGIYLTKGPGFTGKIEYSSDNSNWSEEEADSKYVRVGY